MDSAFLAQCLCYLFPDSPEIVAGSEFLSALLPGDMDTFYRYAGSLTTPPCSESVVWTVFPSPIPISEQQVSNLILNP